MTSLGAITSFARFVRDTGAWRPGHAHLLWRNVVHRARNDLRGYSDHDHMVAAARWLARAQDATDDGGIVGRYRLDRGWTSSYPETTGYCVPTLLALREELDEPQWHERAHRCIEFLLGLQLPSGAFPGLEVHENRTQPSFFNTAQIVNGLVAWHRATNDWRAADSALRAGKWLASIQDADGAFRQAIYMGVATAYSAHATCWLAELGQHLKEPRFIDAAVRHLDWVLAARDPETGFIERMGFSADDHAARRAVTHTIAYTLSGLLLTAQIANRDDAITHVEHAAYGIARRLELSGSLPGMLDARWKKLSDWTCLTGNAQMAILWMRLWQKNGDPRLVNAAFKALDHVKRAQPMEASEPALFGSIAGSDPVWGGYITNALPNWAAKFFIDALLLKRHVSAVLEARELGARPLPVEVPTHLPPIATQASRQPRVVLLSTPNSRKAARILHACDAFGFEPAAIVLEEPANLGAQARVTRLLADEGVDGVLARLAPLPGGGADGAAADVDLPIELGAAELARQRGIPTLRATSLVDPRLLAKLRDLDPDLFVCAGAGILRPGLLALPRLGTVNAHMGLLPHYRGMNVAEWAAFNGDAVGVTAHLVDAGIDTGDLLVARVVGLGDATSIAQLRDAIDAAQIELLAHVLHWIWTSGTLPPRVSQSRYEIRQWFGMHPDLKAMLARDLARRRDLGN